MVFFFFRIMVDRTRAAEQQMPLDLFHFGLQYDLNNTEMSCYGRIESPARPLPNNHIPLLFRQQRNRYPHMGKQMFLLSCQFQMQANPSNALPRNLLDHDAKTISDETCYGSQFPNRFRPT